MTGTAAPALVATLAAVGEWLQSLCDRWWVIGSAAVVLLGGATEPGDVDVLLSERDARDLFPRLGLSLVPGPDDDRFRSTLFARWHGAPLPVEFMAGFQHRREGQWSAVDPMTRVEHSIAGHRLFTPEGQELAGILSSFGRDKDLLRAAMLRSG